MEKNGLEVTENVPHSIWIYLPTEIWFQIFRWLRATRYIVLIGVLGRGFREFVLDYFKSASPWTNKNMNVAIIGTSGVGKISNDGVELLTPILGKTTMLAQLLLQARLHKNIEHKFAAYLKAHPKLSAESRYNTFLNGRTKRGPIIQTTYIKPYFFNTAMHKFTLFDTPGRRIIHAYRMCSQVNTVIIVLHDKNGLYEQLQHWMPSLVTAAWTSLTHSQFIIVVNYYAFSRSIWEHDQKSIYSQLVKTVPSKLLPNIKLIPINALSGFNIYSPHAGIDDANSWYKGPTLYRALHAVWEKLEYPEQRIEMPLAMTFLRTVRIGGIGPVIIGTVHSGILRPGMQLRIIGANIPDTPLVVASIQHDGVNMNEAGPCDHIGISFSTNSKRTGWTDGTFARARFGKLLANVNNPPKRVKSFMAAIAGIHIKLHQGVQYKAVYQGTHIFVRFETFIQVLDRDNNDVADKNLIRPGNTCLALCIPTQEMWIHPKIPNQKKDSSGVILFTFLCKICAVARIDSVTFYEEDEVNTVPKQLAHKRQLVKY